MQRERLRGLQRRREGLSRNGAERRGGAGAFGEDRRSAASDEDGFVGLEEEEESACAALSQRAVSVGGSGCASLVGHEGRVLALTFAEVEDRCLLSGGVDGIIRLWAASTARLRIRESAEMAEEAAEQEEEETGVAAVCSGRGRPSPSARDSCLPLCLYRGSLQPPIWSLAASPLGCVCCLSVGATSPTSLSFWVSYKCSPGSREAPGSEEE